MEELSILPLFLVKIIISILCCFIVYPNKSAIFASAFTTLFVSASIYVEEAYETSVIGFTFLSLAILNRDKDALTLITLLTSILIGLDFIVLPIIISIILLPINKYFK